MASISLLHLVPPIQTRSHGGEYHHLSFSHMGKGHTLYIRNVDVPQIKQELQNYKKFKELSDKLICLEIEYAKHRRAEKKTPKDKNLR